MPETKVVQRKLRVIVRHQLDPDKPIEPQIAISESVVEVHDSMEMYSYLNREDVISVQMFWDRVLGSFLIPVELKTKKKEKQDGSNLPRVPDATPFGG